MDDTRFTEFDAADEPAEEPDDETQLDESDDDEDFDESDDEGSDDLEDDEEPEDEDEDDEDDSADDLEDDDESEDEDEDDDEPDELIDAAAEADNEDEPDELIDAAALADNDEADETDFSTVATGSSLEEAKRNALAQLRKLMPFVAETAIEYEVVDEAVKGGFLGRGRVLAKVEARVRPTAAASSAPAAQGALPSAAEDLKVFIEDSVHLMGLEATVSVTETADTTTAEIGGDDLGLLIGRHGQTIDALQYISAIAVNRKRKTRRQVIVDAEGYRERRNSSLHVLADRVAQRVARERTSVTLKPMTAAERKVIHLHLKDDRRVETVSEGQEPHRSVVIVPREK
jgi:spoIIIJ-associated protein